MPYVNMQDMLCGAREGRCAVGAFNLVDSATAQDVVKTAENKPAPVIIQTSVKTVELYGARPLAAACPM